MNSVLSSVSETSFRWVKRIFVDAGDDESSTVSNEPDVEYTEVVHSRSVDLSRGNSSHNSTNSSLF